MCLRGSAAEPVSPEGAHRNAEGHAVHCSPVARPSIPWVAGDPTWSPVYYAVQWVALPSSILLTAAFALVVLGDFGDVTSAQAGLLSWSMPSGILGPWVWLAVVLGLLPVATILQTRRAVYKVAPTSRGLAIRVSPLWTTVIPWPDIRWCDSTHVEWIRLVGTGRAVVTPEQSQRIYRWFRRS